MKLSSLFLFFFIQFAAFPSQAAKITVRLRNCLLALKTEGDTKSVVDQLNQAFENLSLNTFEEAKLIALENLLQNDEFRNSLQNQRGEAHLKFKALINRGASQAFYKKSIYLIEKYSPPHALSFILLAKQNLIPAFMPAPGHLPPGALKENPKPSKLLSDALSLLFEDEPTIKPAYFTRRLFAYIGLYPELTQREKYNLTVNFILELRKKQSEYNQLVDRARMHGTRTERVALYSFYLYPEAASDGTLFICGTLKCNYFFAITLDSKFFIVHRGPSSNSFEIEKWATHKRLREALPPEEEE
ncbi:MAG: hypothetical protein R3A80_08465 [Bdellovibrionota bacterium]